MRCVRWLLLCLPTLAWGQGTVVPRLVSPIAAKGSKYTWVSSDTSAIARRFITLCLTQSTPDDLVPSGKRAVPLPAHATVTIQYYSLTRSVGCSGVYAYRLFAEAWMSALFRDRTGQRYSIYHYFVLTDGRLTVFNTRDVTANERKFEQLVPSLRKELNLGPAKLDSLKQCLRQGYVNQY